MADLLIAKGADLTAKDSDGKTPLALAIEKKHEVVVKLLKKYGAKK